MTKKTWVIPDKCYVKPRDNSAKLQAFYKIESGQWRRESTGTDDLDTATEVALQRYLEIHNLTDKGVPLRATGELVVRFNDVAQTVRQNWLDLIEAGMGKPVYDSYIKVINGWLIPYFDGVPLTEVDDDAIADYEDYRRKKLGKEPAKSTINNHNCVLRAIFDLARRKKYINASQIPVFTVKNKGEASKPRPGFTYQEFLELEKFMLGWRQDHPKSQSRYKARLLFFYVQLLATCGIRTGKEIDAIKWKHVTENYKNVTNGKMYIRIDLPHRKTERPFADDHVLVSKDFQRHLDSLKEHTRRTEPEDFLFCDTDGSLIKGFSELFRYCLEDAGLRYKDDDPRKGRTLYSLRHYYATQRIARENVRREILSKHMATSIIMLEKFYVDVETAAEAEKLAPSAPLIPPVQPKAIDIVGGEGKLKAIQQIQAMDIDDATKARLIEAL